MGDCWIRVVARNTNSYIRIVLVCLGSCLCSVVVAIMILVKLTIRWTEGIYTPCLMAVKEKDEKLSPGIHERIFHYLGSKHDIYKGYKTEDWEIVDIERMIDTSAEKSK